jgi:hypothetical protein
MDLERQGPCKPSPAKVAHHAGAKHRGRFGGAKPVTVTPFGKHFAKVVVFMRRVGGRSASLRKSTFGVRPFTLAYVRRR